MLYNDYPRTDDEIDDFIAMEWRCDEDISVKELQERLEKRGVKLPLRRVTHSIRRYVDNHTENKRSKQKFYVACELAKDYFVRVVAVFVALCYVLLCSWVLLVGSIEAVKYYVRG